MMLPSWNWCWFTLAAGLLGQPGGAALSGEQILRRALENENRQSELRAQYLDKEHVENRHANADGSPGKLYLSQDFEIIYLEGAPYRKRVAVNDKPLKPKQAQEEAEKMQKTAAERWAERAEPRSVRRSISAGVGFRDILRLMDHVLLREEEIRGRQAWVVQSSPKPDAVAERPGDDKVLCYRYTHWIDQEDLVVAQQEFEVIREGVDARPGTRSRAVFAKEMGSPWFLRSVDGDFITNAAGSTRHWWQQHRYTDFKKFSAESKIEFKEEEK